MTKMELTRREFLIASGAAATGTGGGIAGAATVRRINVGPAPSSGCSRKTCRRRSVTTMIESNTSLPSFRGLMSWCDSHAMELDLPLPAECWIK